MKTAFSEYLDHNEKRLSDQGTSLGAVLVQIAQLNDKFKNVESKCQILSDENITLRNELIIVKKQYEESEKQLTQLRTEINESQTTLKDQFNNLESKCQLMRDENIILRKELNLVKEQNGSSSDEIVNLKHRTDELRKTIDEEVKNIISKQNVTAGTTDTLKNELKCIKKQNDDSAKEIVQLKTGTEDLRKILDEHSRYNQLLPPMVNKISSIEKSVNLQIDSLNEYHENHKGTDRKVRMLHQKLTEFIAQMNASGPTYVNDFNSPHSHHHREHRIPCKSPSTSSLINGQMAGDFRSSTRHHNASPLFHSKTDNMLGPLYWKDDLSEISNMSEELFREVKELHHHNNRQTGNGSNSLYSDE